MLHTLLLNLAQPFVDLDFINGQQAQVAIDHILTLKWWTKIDALPIKPIVKSKHQPDLTQHLKHIDELRTVLTTYFSEPTIIENRINEILSYFMPTNEVIQNWEKQTRHARLLILSQYAYYIKTDQNAKNQIYQAPCKYGDLTISINLAKPEKTQAQILAEKNAKVTNQNEPRCGICIENLNFHGSLTKPSRENLRVIYESFNDQTWFFQYSPYAYLNGHFVLNDLIHQPMKIDDQTIVKLLSFVNQHPEFMLGSNADLPIVGGSLLGHNHFQGALQRLPITHAKPFFSCQTHNCTVELLEWPLNTLKISASTQDDCSDLVNRITHFWKTYQGFELINQQNHTVTLIAEKLSTTYVCYVILRNNSVNDIHPQGIYHVHADKFHIKQENIGLMEAAGLAILPGRLINEFESIVALNKQLQGSALLAAINKDQQLVKHATWIANLLNQHPQLSMPVLLAATADVFIKGLEDCQILNQHQFVYWFKQFLVHHPMVIDNQHGLKVAVLNIGNIVKQIYLFDQPLLLEYQDANQYLNNQILLNAFVGPACGRIENGIINHSSQNFKLPVDAMHNYIHGMDHKWSDLVYDISIKDHVVEFTAHQFNPDLQANYTITNTMTINPAVNELTFNYQINSDIPSLCNPSHHFYWTLNQDGLAQQCLSFQPKAIWKLNAHHNPDQRCPLTINKDLSIAQWLVELNHITGQNQTIIDHPFELLIGELKYHSSTLMMTMDSQLTELVIYTYLNHDGLAFKTNAQAICFESQYVPTAAQHINAKQVITTNYANTVKYQFKLKS